MSNSSETISSRARSTELLLQIKTAALRLLPTRKQHRESQSLQKAKPLEAFAACLKQIIREEDLRCLLSWNRYCLLIQNRHASSPQVEQFIAKAMRGGLQQLESATDSKFQHLARECLHQCLGEKHEALDDGHSAVDASSPRAPNPGRATPQRGVFAEPSMANYTAEDVFQRAKQLVDDEAFEEAISQVEEWISSAKEQGKNSMLAYIRAHAYRKLNRVDEALPILEPFRKENTIPWVAFELGLIYKELGRPDEAYLCFCQARCIQPDFNWAEIEAARTTHEFDVSLGQLEAISSPAIEGEFVEVHLDSRLRFGSLLLLIGWCREAMGSGTQARLSDPLEPEAHAQGSTTFYSRPDVCRAMGLPEHQMHGFAALLDCSGFRRWSEQGELRLYLEPEGEASSIPTTALLCLAEVQRETNLQGFLEAAMGVFRMSIDSGNLWPESLKLFTPQTVLETARVFARHVEEERDRVEAHWLTRTPMEEPPLASVVFVQLGSFLTAKPAVLQLAKSGLPLELIVVNNSPERFSETFHLLDRYADIRPSLRIGILNRALNLGFSAGCNLGAQYASGECVIFHNNDLYADSVEDYNLLITRALKDPNAIHSAYQYFPDGTLMQEGITAARIVTAKGWSIPLFNGFSVGRNQTRGKVIACSGSLMAISGQLFSYLGGFSEEIVYAHFEDFDLCLRARQQGIPVRIWNDIRFYHAEGTGSASPYHLSGTTSHINRLLFSLKWRRVLESMDLPTEYAL